MKKPISHKTVLSSRFIALSEALNNHAKWNIANYGMTCTAYFDTYLNSNVKLGSVDNDLYTEHSGF